MSHKTVYLGISADELNGDVIKDKVSLYVETAMSKYVEGTATPKNIKCDYYLIGGRWDGAIGTVKGTKNILSTENGTFIYTLFDEYDAIVNNGQRGPYFLDGIEYIPISGGFKKDIDWNSISKFNLYKKFKLLELVLNRDPKIGDKLPSGYKIVNNDLYIETDGHKNQILKKSETFSEWIKRQNIKFSREMLPPDAYVDKNGVWHDENDIWDEFERNIINYKLEDMSKNPFEAVQKNFIKQFENFMDNELQDDDYFVILDCHCFP